MVAKVLAALGIYNSRGSVIDWQLYFKIQSIFKYHTAAKHILVDFWLKVSLENKFNFNECVLLQFFNQYSQPEVEGKEIISSLELLSRGAFT